MPPTDPAPAANPPRNVVISGCMFNGSSVVFYVDAQQNLRGYTNQASSDIEPAGTNADPRENYVDKLQKLKGQPVASQTRDVAALSYELKGGTIRSRLYYIDKEGFLAELAKDGLGDWEEGSIRKQLNVKAVSHSPITATMSPGSNTIKVFYYKGADQGAQQVKGEIWVAWWNGNTSVWATQPIVSQRL